MSDTKISIDSAQRYVVHLSLGYLFVVYGRTDCSMYRTWYCNVELALGNSFTPKIQTKSAWERFPLWLDLFVVEAKQFLIINCFPRNRANRKTSSPESHGMHGSIRRFFLWLLFTVRRSKTLSVMNSTTYFAPFTCPLCGYRFLSNISTNSFFKVSLWSCRCEVQGIPFSSSPGYLSSNSSVFSMVSAPKKARLSPGINASTHSFSILSWMLLAVHIGGWDSHNSSKYLFLMCAKTD